MHTDNVVTGVKKKPASTDASSGVRHAFQCAEARETETILLEDAWHVQSTSRQLLCLFGCFGLLLSETESPTAD